jgi:ferredoxin-NADP reductase
MTEPLEKYASRMDISKFGQIMPRRRQHIAMGAPEPPKWEYPANTAAEKLHPDMLHLIVSGVIDRNGAKSFVLAPDQDNGTKELPYFRAGQYISVSLQIGDSLLNRPFSLCCPPSDALRGEYMLTVKPAADGFAANYICENWTAGSRICTSSPLGEFTYEPLRDAPHIIGIAGGSGITPLYSLACAVADGTEDLELRLLYGSRKKKDILLYDELEKLAASSSKLHVAYILSEEEAPGFEQGLITAELIRKHMPIDSACSIFICGPEAMCEFVGKEITKLGLQRKYVRYETNPCKTPEKDPAYPAEAVGKIFQLTVCLRNEEKTFPCNGGESILTAMERHGIKAPSRCHSGECGFCRSRLVSGRIYLPDATDHRRMADQMSGHIHPCCAFALSDLTISVASEQGYQPIL